MNITPTVQSNLQPSIYTILLRYSHIDITQTYLSNKYNSLRFIYMPRFSNININVTISDAYVSTWTLTCTLRVNTSNIVVTVQEAIHNVIWMCLRLRCNLIPVSDVHFSLLLHLMGRKAAPGHRKAAVQRVWVIVLSICKVCDR